MIEILVTLIVFLLVVLVILNVRSNPADREEYFREKAKQYLAEADELVTVSCNRIVVKGIEYRKKQARKALTVASEGDLVDLVPEPVTKFDS